MRAQDQQSSFQSGETHDHLFWRVGGGGGGGGGGGERVDSNSFIIIPKLNSLPTLIVVTNSKFICYVSKANLSALLL